MLDGTDHSERRKLHAYFGQCLEQAEGLAASEILDYFRQNAEEESTDPHVGDRAFDIAYHYDASGDDRGIAYQLLAGELECDHRCSQLL
ncbi:MAG TPA: hypothetical protein P5307_11495 [Pirellulaceae bacterium]|nr:hypothetical protein [Planctomycetaceae bacterium]HRX79679.1 hypothetical protein [Pirellulaceae bacterium]